MTSTDTASKANPQGSSRERPVRGRGTAGIAAVVMAIVACYGTLALVALLSLLGMRLTVNESAWSGAILFFALLAVAAIATGVRRHRSLLPATAAAAGAGLVAYALLVDYRFVVELAGFVALGWAAWRDATLQRRSRSASAH